MIAYTMLKNGAFEGSEVSFQRARELYLVNSQLFHNGYLQFHCDSDMLAEIIKVNF